MRYGAGPKPARGNTPWLILHLSLCHRDRLDELGARLARQLEREGGRRGPALVPAGPRGYSDNQDAWPSWRLRGPASTLRRRWGCGDARLDDRQDASPERFQRRRGLHWLGDHLTLVAGSVEAAVPAVRGELDRGATARRRNSNGQFRLASHGDHGTPCASEQADAKTGARAENRLDDWF